MTIRNILSKAVFRGKNPPFEADDSVRSHLLERVELWQNIYDGESPWRYARKGGLDGGYRRVRSVSAAKALCSELSALCFSQQMDLRFSDEKTAEFVRGVLQDNAFWSCFPLFLEKMFALGGGVIKVYCEGEKIRLDYVQAQGFIPTQYDEKGVYGGTIFSSSSKDGVDYLLAETHSRTDSGFVVKNRLFKRFKNGDYKEVELSELYPDLEAETAINGLQKPLFVYFRPACSGSGVLGSSVFAHAADTLESLDIVFDSLQREFILGKKRIIVPTSALRGEYGRDGKLHKYFDEQDEVYQAFSPDDKEELKIYDNSAQLRVSEHIEALEQLLDLLCMQTGLSAGSLSYHSSTASTATEVVARNDKTFRTKTAHQQLIREGLLQVLENIVLLAAATGKLPCKAAEDKPVITFPDSVSRDNSSKIDNAVKLLNAGVIDKNKALAEIYGLSDSEIQTKEEEENV